MLSLALSEFYGHQRSRATQEHRVGAREAADRALALAPDLPEAHAALGAYFAQCEEKAYAQARSEFEIALRGRPNDAVFVAALGYVERRLGLWKEATARLQRASDLDPKDHFIALEAALLCTRLRDYDAAVPYYDRAISADPGWLEPYVCKASMLQLRDGNTREAWRVLRVSQRDMRPEGAGDLRNAMRECLVMDGDYAAALASTNLPGFLERAEIHAFLGQTAWSRTYYDSARAYWQRQLAASPYDGTAHAMLGIAYAGLGMAREALHEGKVAVDLRPLENDPMYAPPRHREPGANPHDARRRRRRRSTPPRSPRDALAALQGVPARTPPLGAAPPPSALRGTHPPALTPHAREAGSPKGVAPHRSGARPLALRVVVSAGSREDEGQTTEESRDGRQRQEGQGQGPEAEEEQAGPRDQEEAGQATEERRMTAASWPVARRVFCRLESSDRLETIKVVLRQ
jgi:tetratricopeptide (TPR) repeat protein